MAGFADYGDYDGLGLAQLVRDGEVSAGELLQEAIARADRLNDSLNAIVYRYDDMARDAVAGGLPDGPFTGVPFLLKDLHLCMRGTVKSNGSAAWRDDVADHDSTLVERFRNAGLVIFGRTNSPELGLQPVTEPAASGPSRNPWDTARTPGGSSGGSAAAVAAGIVPMAHASDGGGSIRIPASCCGLVGLKPSRARVPNGPDLVEEWAGQSGNFIVSRSVRDSAAMLDAVRGPELGAPYCAPHHPGRFLDAVTEPPDQLRIAVAWRKQGPGEYHVDVLEGLEATVELLEQLGHRVEAAQPDIDGDSAAGALYKIICVDTALDLHRRAEQLKCLVDDLDIEEGTRLTAAAGESLSATEYLAAIRSNHELGRALGHFHQYWDILLAPTLASPPVPVGYISEAPPGEYGERLFNYMGDTALFNQTGQPSLSLPLHWTGSGLPVGMMFSAACGNEALLLRLAGQLEQARPWRERRPPVTA